MARSHRIQSAKIKTRTTISCSYVLPLIDRLKYSRRDLSQVHVFVAKRLCSFVTKPGVENVATIHLHGLAR